ncbi:MAG: hypothetical protein U1C71_00015, partial [archaeon]|nr:hypothetical protein [archaeon]
MRFYLSSYKIGKETAAFKRLFPKNRKTAYIPNALDFSSDLARRKKSIQSDILPLTELGLKVEILDLRDYFSKPKKLEKKCSEFGVFWVRGGNAFVLRQAMHKSGFDVLVKK